MQLRDGCYDFCLVQSIPCSIWPDLAGTLSLLITHINVLQSAITLVKMIWRQFFLECIFLVAPVIWEFIYGQDQKLLLSLIFFQIESSYFSHFFKHLQTWASDSFLLLISLLDAEASKEFSHQAFPPHGEWSLSFRFPACLAYLFLCSFLCSLQ